MDKRKELRPDLPKIEATEKCSVDEKFQNTTLRQVIKLQHQLLVALFRNYAVIRKTDLSGLSDERKKRFIESALSKDIAFKNKVVGLMIGQFTIDELEIYLPISSEINRRIVTISKKRLKDSILELS